MCCCNRTVVGDGQTVPLRVSSIDEGNDSLLYKIRSVDPNSASSTMPLLHKDERTVYGFHPTAFTPHIVQHGQASAQQFNHVNNLPTKGTVRGALSCTALYCTHIWYCSLVPVLYCTTPHYNLFYSGTAPVQHCMHLWLFLPWRRSRSRPRLLSHFACSVIRMYCPSRTCPTKQDSTVQ